MVKARPIQSGGRAPPTARKAASWRPDRPRGLAYGKSVFIEARALGAAARSIVGSLLCAAMAGLAKGLQIRPGEPQRIGRARYRPDMVDQDGRPAAAPASRKRGQEAGPKRAPVAAITARGRALSLAFHD